MWREPFATIECSRMGHLSIYFPTEKFISCPPSSKMNLSSSASDERLPLRITRRLMVEWKYLTVPFWRPFDHFVPKTVRVELFS